MVLLGISPRAVTFLLTSVESELDLFVRALGLFVLLAHTVRGLLVLVQFTTAVLEFVVAFGTLLLVL